jgi:conjugative relaxase-like TrwC/TraI family protein
VSAVLTISPGYDPRYLTRQVGQGAENYYLSAVAEHGEPPGRWWGPGAEELGLEPGSEIDAAVMEKLYSTFLDPRDPDFLNRRVPDDEKTRLGRRPPKYDKAANKVFLEKLEAEPDADPERQKELWREAKSEVQQAVMHHDATFSPPKSFTLLHAGLQAKAQQAREAGDLVAAEAYEAAAEKLWDCIDAGAAASLQYLIEHAGTARRGPHSQVIDGRSTGKYIDAGGWVVGRFRQHTNREGEPHLHIHQAILNRQLGSDGRWSALDSTALYRARPGAAAYGERVMYEKAQRELGIELIARPDGNGYEVVGVTPEQITAFSSRASQVTDLTAAWIADYEATHGRKPSARTVFQMAQYAGKLTKAKKLKLKDAPSRQAELAKWEKLTTDKEIGLLSQIPDRALGRFTARKAAQAAKEMADLDYQKVLAAAVADAQAAKSAFTRHEVLRHINKYLPAYLGGLPEERLEALLEELTDAALDPSGPAAVRLLNAPDVVPIPEELQREDGTSVYQAPNFERYTTAAQLDTEAQLTASAVEYGAPGVHPEQALITLAPCTSAEAFTALVAEASAAPTFRIAPDAVALEEDTLSEDQAAAVYGILTSGRRVDVLVGPAGAGKSFAVKRLADAWKQTTGTRVVGLTTAQNAAYVLANEGMDDTWNIARWLDRIDKGKIRLQRGQLIVVDEAGMVPTKQLARIMRLAVAAGAKVVWAGDPAQLSAPEAGGMMRHLVETGGAYELTTVKRFAEAWEGAASLRLRQGVEAVLDEYEAHGRLLEDDREKVEADALQAYLADYLDGHQSALLAPTNAKAAELAGQVRERLIALGRVKRNGVTLQDEMGNAVNTAGEGDLVVARQNDQKVAIGGTLRQLSNRDVLRVAEVGADGSVTAQLVGKDGRPGGRVTLSPDYVRKHIELAYAGTVHSTQGRTLYRSYAVVDDTVTRNMLYVMLTRGAFGNFAFIARDAVNVADLRPGPEQAEDGPEIRRDKFAILRGILQRAEDSETSIEAMLAEAQRPTHMAHLGSMWMNELREHLADAYITSAEQRGSLTPGEAERLRADEARDSLGRLLWQLQMSGRDAEQILDRAIAERPFDDPADPVESIAKALHWRITTAGEKRGLDVKTLEPSEAAIGATWRARTPRVGIAWVDEFLAENALQMDVRQNVLGLEALERTPAWMSERMGQPPAAGDDVERGVWAARAGTVLGYREMYGVVDEADPLGPEPSRQNPEQRAAWFAAHDALTGQKPGQVSKAKFGELWSTRARYERELAWAPPYVADELQRVSTGARTLAQEAVLLRAQAAAASGAERVKLERQADAQQAMADTLARRQALLEEVHAARVRWHESTRDLRMEALRADAELRRRDDVDAARLSRLHGDHEHDITAELADPEPTEQVHPDQLTIDGWGPDEHPAQVQQRAQAAAEAEREQAETDPLERLYARYAMARDAGEQGLPVGTIAKALAADDLAEAIEAQEQMRDRYEHERRQAEPVEAEHEQITLDLFGAGEGSEAATERMSEAVEKARAVRQVLKSRAVEEEAAEEERVRRRAARPGPRHRDEVERTQQRTAETRQDLEQRERDRQPEIDPQLREAVRLARADFPGGRFRPRRRDLTQEQQQRRPEPLQPERGMDLGF